MTPELWLERQGRARVEKGHRFADVVNLLRANRDGISFFKEETYAGAPAGASAELGERFLDLLGEKAGEAVGSCSTARSARPTATRRRGPFRFIFLNPLMIRLSNWFIGLRPNPIA